MQPDSRERLSEQSRDGLVGVSSYSMFLIRAMIQAGGCCGVGAVLSVL